MDTVNKRFEETGLRADIVIVGMGLNQIDQDAFKVLAKGIKGKFYNANDAESLRKILDERISGKSYEQKTIKNSDPPQNLPIHSDSSKLPVPPRQNDVTVDSPQQALDNQEPHIGDLEHSDTDKRDKKIQGIIRVMDSMPTLRAQLRHDMWRTSLKETLCSEGVVSIIQEAYDNPLVDFLGGYENFERAMQVTSQSYSTSDLHLAQGIIATCILGYVQNIRSFNQQKAMWLTNDRIYSLWGEYKKPRSMFLVDIDNKRQILREKAKMTIQEATYYFSKNNNANLKYSDMVIVGLMCESIKNYDCASSLYDGAQKQGDPLAQFEKARVDIRINPENEWSRNILLNNSLLYTQNWVKAELEKTSSK